MKFITTTLIAHAPDSDAWAPAPLADDAVAAKIQTEEAVADATHTHALATG
jgi:hypothetical protein